MAKIVLLGADAYRVITRRRNSFRLQPAGAENPHTTIFRLPGETRWAHSPHGSSRGSRVDWYQQVDDDTFKKTGSGRW